jgi:hypothetical protein
MMDGMGMMAGHGAMMWVMGGVALLAAAVLVLGLAALLKYLFFGHRK